MTRNRWLSGPQDRRETAAKKTCFLPRPVAAAGTIGVNSQQVQPSAVRSRTRASSRAERLQPITKGSLCQQGAHRAPILAGEHPAALVTLREALGLAHELAALGQLTVSGLRARYAELFGDETRVGNKVWLIRRIAWRLRALDEGDLSQRARQRAAELVHDADVQRDSHRPVRRDQAPQGPSRRAMMA
jgi:hypothetical protein